MQKENVKLQNEVVLLNDNMNKDINNIDEHKQIFELRIELQNKINEENEKLSSSFQNNKASVEIIDLERFKNLNKNNQESTNQRQIQNLPNILLEKYKDTSNEIFKNKQNNLINSIEGAIRV